MSQMVVEGTLSGQDSPSRIGSIASTPQGARVRIVECGARKSKLIAGFTAGNVDQALAMVQGHQAMAGLELRTVY